MTNYEWITILISIIGSTWYLSAQINDCVKHSVCEKRRENCQCVKEIKRLEKSVKELKNEAKDDEN